jgi:prolipoprotein diacylglyceryltransferase
MNIVKLLMALIYLIVSMSIIWLMDSYSSYRNGALVVCILLYYISLRLYNKKLRSQKTKNN